MDNFREFIPVDLHSHIKKWKHFSQKLAFNSIYGFRNVWQMEEKIKDATVLEMKKVTSEVTNIGISFIEDKHAIYKFSLREQKKEILVKIPVDVDNILNLIGKEVDFIKPNTEEYYLVEDI